MADGPALHTHRFVPNVGELFRECGYSSFSAVAVESVANPLADAIVIALPPRVPPAIGRNAGRLRAPVFLPDTLARYSPGNGGIRADKHARAVLVATIDIWPRAWILACQTTPPARRGRMLPVERLQRLMARIPDH